MRAYKFISNSVVFIKIKGVYNSKTTFRYQHFQKNMYLFMYMHYIQ